MLLLVSLMLLSSIRFLEALKTQCVLLLVLSSMFSWLFLLSSVVENKSVGAGVVDVVIYYQTSRHLAKGAGVRRVVPFGSRNQACVCHTCGCLATLLLCVQEEALPLIFDVQRQRAPRVFCSVLHLTI